MKRHHKKEFDQLKLKSNEQVQIDQFIPTINLKWPGTNSRQIEASRLLIAFIAGNLQALSIVDCPYFRKFIGYLKPEYSIHTRKHLSTSLLPSIKSTLHEKILRSIQSTQSKFVSLTLDIWPNRNMRSYLGITCHYINDFKLFLQC